MAKVPKVMKPPAGEIYHSIEAPKGELGYFIVSDGSTQPYRIRVRPPSFVNLQALDVMCRGQLVADVIAVIGTLDIVLGEVDRVIHAFIQYIQSYLDSNKRPAARETFSGRLSTSCWCSADSRSPSLR